ncbi:MAG: YbhB/YbcL family Raf kinase inhibitor-like protein [Frankia sp.]|nr:YbhB/YbcL family Raf kinase inhibitor-like protein [Frankia sp.]
MGGEGETGAMRLTSLDFADNARIPQRNARRGENQPPTLTWSPPPLGTAELELVMEDPDAPRGTFVHWVVTGIPPSTTSLEPGRLPAGAVEGRNSFGAIGYDGPQPPPGDAHHYVFHLIAAHHPLGLWSGV